ncbi:MAG: hypothetical protein MUE60_02515 [Candidatus Eisenbacteria bacterium]|nr:hypothetical protein [Candidatus Eisenbacteria bacterium]
MSYMTVERHHLHLRAIVRGNGSFALSPSNVDDLLHAAREELASAVLVDAREAGQAAGIVEWFTVADTLAHRRPPTLRSAALVVCAGQLRDARFAELVARNRGLNLRVFEDDRAAVEWLEGDDCAT